MIQTSLIENAHNDLVTDAAYDFYGLRLATCSLDQRIKVWQLDEVQGTWSVEDDWKAHDAAITKVSWAHPEFELDQPQVNGASTSSSSRWLERAVLVDAKGTVRAVEFAPQHFGLKIATISSDNHLRIYECLEQPSLLTWQLAEEVDVLTLPSSSPATHSLSHTVTQVTPTQTLSTLEGTSVALAAHAIQQQQPPSRPGMGNKEADGGWCISWCKDRYWGEVIAAACGIDGKVKVIQLSPSRRPSTLLTLDPSPAKPSTEGGNTRPTSQSAETESTAYSVTSIAWAPSCGRSYHLIATGSRDGRVRIWRVKPPTLNDEYDQDGDGESDGADTKWNASIVGDFDDHKSSIGRVEWNITGTVLSSAGNDGRVRLWKATTGNVWRPAGHISVEQAEEQQPDVDMEENVVVE
ncbi:Protein transport protein SEC13 [Abortiporus biennis]